MSEYIEVAAETTDDPATMRVITNLTLADAGRERYASLAEMEEGSPLAQALAVVPGISALVIDDRELIVTADESTPWHIVIADLSAAIKDFFL